MEDTTPLLGGGFYSAGLLADPGILKELQKPRAPSIIGDWQTTLYCPHRLPDLPVCDASRPGQ